VLDSPFPLINNLMESIEKTLCDAINVMEESSNAAPCFD
jgi:hypothetical protein